MSVNDILVVGATGNQGNAVVDELLASDEDFTVYGLTRDASQDKAQELEQKGVEVVEGDLLDKESLRDAVSRVDAAFLVTNFWTQGYDRQVQQGTNFADVAEEEGLDYVVFSGVSNQELGTGVPHFESAREITEDLRTRDFDLTVLNPVFFMENWEVMVEDGVVPLPITEETEHNMTTYGDTAKTVRISFENPDEFAGEQYDIVSDKLTLTEVADTISDVTGDDVDPYHVPLEDAYEEFGEEFTVMCEYFVEEGGRDSFEGNIPRIERDFGFRTERFREYLTENGWEGGKEQPAHIAGWAKAFQQD